MIDVVAVGPVQSGEQIGRGAGRAEDLATQLDPVLGRAFVAPPAEANEEGGTWFARLADETIC